MRIVKGSVEVERKPDATSTKSYLLASCERPFGSRLRNCNEQLTSMKNLRANPPKAAALVHSTTPRLYDFQRLYDFAFLVSRSGKGRVASTRSSGALVQRPRQPTRSSNPG